MENYRVRTDIILAANTYIGRKLGEFGTFPLMGLYREVDSYLRFAIGAGYTDTELAFGWLIEEGRIELECYGTNAWAHYRALEPLSFDRPIKRLGFENVPTFAGLLNAQRTTWEAEENLAKAKRKAHEAEQALRAAYDKIRLAAQTPEPISAPALG
jgi:hypothetical protein